MTQFVIAGLNGLTLAALYFIVASGFTLVFGLLRVVNLAHGSLYLLGAYLGWSIWQATGSWLLGLLAAALAMAVVGAVLQIGLFSWMQGQDMRQALLTIGLSIVIADQLLRQYGGLAYQITAPEPLRPATPLAGLGISYPTFRLFVLGLAVLIAVCLWLLLNRTRTGIMIRAGIDDRAMLSASGINVQRVFVLVFALGAGLAGLAGVVGGTAFSVAPGRDVEYLLAALVVVIVGGMGSVGGAALGAALIGVTQQYGLAYFPTYSYLLTFALMVGVLALRPQGLLGRAA